MQEIEREPIRPYQEGARVTEAMTGVRLDLELCAICTRPRGVGDHHLIFRSKGGHEGPTMPACNVCHDRIHAHEWNVELLENGMQILDAEGQVIWRLMRWPLPGEAGQFVQLLDKVTEATRLMPEIAPALLPWQAVEVFRALRELGEGGWRAQVRLIGEMYTWRMPGWNSPDKVQALCGLFGLRRAQCYNHLMVWQAFGDSPALSDTQLGMGYAIEAARSSDPEAFLRFAQERKLAHPTFSRDDLKVEIVRAGARRNPAEAPSTGPSKCWGKCCQCAAVGWHERLPVGSTGEPVKPEDYREV